jgi:hypothetical protein
VVPRRFRCHPVDEAAATFVEPAFTSVDLRRAPSAYGQLADTCPPEITGGTEDEGEMGAFNFLASHQRLTNLTMRMDEYPRFGLEAGMVFETRGGSMRGDFSRVTFRPENHFSGALLQHGRVQLDAEFNEHVAIEAYRDQATRRDVIGRAGAPIDGGERRLRVELPRQRLPDRCRYGGKDRMLREAAARLHRVLAEVGVEHDVKEYPEAGHGFINDHDGAGDRTPLLFALLGKLSPGADYHEASALDARRRIIAFFAAHLKA